MKKFWRKLLLVALLAAATLSGCACGKKEDTVKVGYTIYQPMNYYDDAGNFVGFDTELAKAVFASLGKKVEFVEINWDTKLVSLRAKEIDCIWNGMTITDELQSAILIGNPYLENRQVILCQKAVAANYKTKESLASASEVLAEAGSAGESVAKAVAGANVLTVAAQRDTLLEVKTSANKVAVVDLNLARVLTGEGTDFSDLTYVDVGFPEEEFGIGFRTEDASLCAAVNAEIDKMKADGRYDALLAKYFG